MIQSVWNAFYRDRIDRKYIPPQSATTPILPGNLIAVSGINSGMKFQFQHADLEVFFMAQDIVRFSWEPGRPPPPYALVEKAWRPVALNCLETQDGYLLESVMLRVLVMVDGGIRIEDSFNHQLREELPPFHDGRQWSHQALLQPESHLYGLGERASSLNLRGKSYRMWNSSPAGEYGPGKDPLYLCVPVYLEIHKEGSYLVFYENSYPAKFILTETAGAVFEGGMLRYYFFPGPPAHALERFTDVTGRPNLPPRWALGYHQSKWGYQSDAHIRDVVAGFRQHGLPISAIHLDLDYMDGRREFTIDKYHFPNLRSLAEEIAQQEIKLVAIIDPGVKIDPSYPLYQDGLNQEVFCTLPSGKPVTGVCWPGKVLFPDFTDPHTREWWGGQYPILLNQGIAGFWNDMNEPQSFVSWGDFTLPLATWHALEGLGGDHRQAHNLYGLLMVKSSYEGLLHHQPDHRPWILSRSGWAGIQKYAWNWTGDIDTSWDMLKQTISTVLGSGLSGQPYNGPDIGGFSGNPSAELYIRWFQMATFLPFFRTHSALDTDRREPWTFGETATAIIREFLLLRYRLMPYLYSLAWEATQNGLPLVRPLFWLNPQDVDYWSIDDEFLLGDRILIAPILQEGAESSTVTLPPGRWYSFWDGNPIDGPGKFTLPTRLDRIPVWIRGGCILPLEEQDRTLTLQVYYPGFSDLGISANTLRLYSDAGDGFPASTKEWRLDIFSLSIEKDILTIKRTGEGDFPLPYKNLRVNLIGAQARNIWVDGQFILPSQDKITLPLHFGEARFQVSGLRQTL